MGTIYTVGPNEALIISGGFRNKKKTYIIGGWAWIWGGITHITYLPLMLMTVYPTCKNVETVLGVAITVSSVAHVKIKRELVNIAAEQFGGKKLRDIREAVGATTEGHLRAILGTLTIEEIYREREVFAKRVKTHAEKDLARMGMQIISLTIRDITDSVGYLSSLGKAQIADMKRLADIAVANNETMASVKEHECHKAATDIVYQMKTKIEDSKRQADMQMSVYTSEVNAAKAEAELAYALQEAVIRQRIRIEEMEVEVIQRRREISIEELEIKRKEIELKVMVELPAEAEQFRMEQIAEGEKIQLLELGKAEAAKIEKLGLAEAGQTLTVGKAMANTQLLKARAFQLYNKAATMSLVLEALPKITAHAASPMTKIDEIIIFTGDSKLESDLAKVASQVPVALGALDSSKFKKLKEKIF